MEKRGKISNISRFRKSVSAKPLAVMIGAALLSACSPPTEEVKVVTSAEDCAMKTDMSLEQCEVAYKKALAEAERTGPRFNSMSDCVHQFGPDQCRQSDSGSFFMPFMAGWMVSSVIDDLTRPSHYNPVYRTKEERNSYGGGGYVTSSGSTIRSSGGSYQAPKGAATKKQPTVTKTVSRGGFGSTAAAKSSWGGGSKSGGWGG
jgi:uncharacterized protein YgiB involved in biofilm formation